MDLNFNVHEGLDSPPDAVYVYGNYEYYHYGCDKTFDQGWGCGYRTLQTICSWIKNVKPGCFSMTVPSLDQIQHALVTMEDKPESFKGSKSWIGSFEILLCLDHLYDVSCKIIHVNHGSELSSYITEIYDHFKTKGSPLMMGGESDNSSKGIVGVSLNPEALLVVDPHYVGPKITNQQLQDAGWVKWRNLDSFSADSFYNICLPQYNSYPS